MRRASERGLTLVELLAGLAIAGLAASLVLLTLPRAEESLTAAAERLAGRLRAAADLAVLSGRPIGAEAGRDGYRFYRFETGEWRAFDPTSPLAPVDWSGTVRSARVTVGGAAFAVEETEGEEGSRPRIRFDPIGLATPFTMRLEAQGRALLIRGDAAGGIALEAADG